MVQPLGVEDGLDDFGVSAKHDWMKLNAAKQRPKRTEDILKT